MLTSPSFFDNLLAYQRDEPDREDFLTRPRSSPHTTGGVPGAKPVAPDQRQTGATSRPKVGAFIHGQRPWLSAAGVDSETPPGSFKESWKFMLLAREFLYILRS